MSHTRNPWRILRSRSQYQNAWIGVTEDRVLNAAGQPGIYGTVHFKNLAIGIVPLDAQGYTYLVGQYRYPLRQYSWEIPAGGGSRKAAPVTTARRELLEETGLTARRFKRILRLHLSNSVTDEVAYIFLATGLKRGESNPEASEVLHIKKVPFVKAHAMVKRGLITDAMSVAGILQVAELISMGKKG